MARVASIVAAVILAACGGGGGKVKDTDTTAGGRGGAAAGSVLTLGPASLVADIGGAKQELAITADGTIKADGKPVASLTPAGEVKDIDGNVLVTIAANGAVTIPGEPTEQIVVRDDGAVLDKGEAMLEIGADGLLSGKLIAGEMGNVKVQYTGAPEHRRAMMLAWLSAMFISSRHGGDGVETAPPAPATAPATP